MTTETDSVNSAKSLLGTLPDSPLGSLVVVAGEQRESSNDDGKPKTVWVKVPSDYPREPFDPRSNTWAFPRKDQ